jgi:Flp pilus assembly protein TadD
MLLQGYSWAMEGAIPRAEDVLTALVSKHPGQAEAYPLLIQCAFRRGDAVAADRWIAALAALTPGDAGP